MIDEKILIFVGAGAILTGIGAGIVLAKYAPSRPAQDSFLLRLLFGLK